MEDIKKIQEFFSKPVKENSRLRKQSILIEPAEIKYTESFGTGIKAPGVLHKANAGVFLGAEGAYIIVLPGGTFYVDEDTETAMPIWPLKDQDQALHKALDFTPFAPKYEEWKNWIKRPDALEEAYIVTYTKNKGEKPDSAAYKLRGSALAFMRDLEKDGYITMLTQRPVDGVDEATKDEETEFHTKLDKLVHDTFGKRKGEMEEYNTGIYYNPDTKEKTKDAAKSGMERVKDMLKKIMKEEEGYSKFLKTDDNPEGKTQGLDTKTMNKILMNVIKDLDETIKLGKNLNEDELCAKGKAYIAKRKKPKSQGGGGEKSSAYLSGRAVQVCNGDIKG